MKARFSATRLLVLRSPISISYSDVSVPEFPFPVSHFCVPIHCYLTNCITRKDQLSSDDNKKGLIMKYSKRFGTRFATLLCASCMCIIVGVIAAKNATLSFLVGGSKSGFERAKPILECMGQNIFHCGGTASGQV